MERENEKLKRMVANLKEQYENNGEKPKCCEYCEHFVRHYLRTNSTLTGYGASAYGHCEMGNGTKQRTGDNRCRYFEFGENK